LEPYGTAPARKSSVEQINAVERSPRWALPLFLTARLKYLAGAAIAVFTIALYLFSNHIHLVTPHQLPMWRIDEAVPFVPWTVWIYVSEYALFAAVYISCKDIVSLNKYLYAFVALQLVSALIFLSWPTIYPRDQFPLDPSSMDALTFYLFDSLRRADSPASCCPSLHVSSVFLSVFVLLDGHHRRTGFQPVGGRRTGFQPVGGRRTGFQFAFFFLWGVAIAVSTITTKQHFVVDVLAGFAMAVLFHVVFRRLVRYRAI
jgi:membrane-associated phospholipid phosphatase